jgi:hypothetical protein
MSRKLHSCVRIRNDQEAITMRAHILTLERRVPARARTVVSVDALDVFRPNVRNSDAHVHYRNERRDEKREESHAGVRVKRHYLIYGHLKRRTPVQLNTNTNGTYPRNPDYNNLVRPFTSS